MQSVKPQKSVSFADSLERRGNSIDFQSSQIKSEQDLKSRVTVMKRYLDSLKSRLTTEKNMLEREKLELYNYTIHQQENVVPRQNPQYLNQAIPQLIAFSGQPLDNPSKQHLRGIEEKCDMELNRLQKYVENIQDLRSYWQFLKANHHINELGQRQNSSSNRSLRQARRMHEGVPSAEWLDRNRTFI